MLSFLCLCEYMWGTRLPPGGRGGLVESYYGLQLAGNSLIEGGVEALKEVLDE